MSANSQPAGPSGRSPHDPVAGLVFDDPLSQRSDDDSDRGWGEGSSSNRAGDGGSAADLARFLDEKPPHHI